MFYQPYHSSIIATEEFPLSTKEMRTIPRPKSYNAAKIDLVWKIIEDKFYAKLQSCLESTLNLQLQNLAEIEQLTRSDRIIKVLRKDEVVIDWWERRDLINKL